ncbi:MAG: hypothetical protein NT127_05650 [Sphingobacteriales bacterium]|nr:hypothetical protein [Sphingobacteriales bacterium]
MKKKILTLAFVLISTASFSQSQTKQDNRIQKKEESGNNVYQLYPTKNNWTFIKLDTRNGKMWQEHFTVNEDGIQTEIILNPVSLVFKEKEINGRFNLYATENMYNFLLLDQIDGDVFQVQWSMDAKNRGIFPIK